MRERGAPSLVEAVATVGGIAVALGVLFVTIDVRAAHSGRAAEVAMFGGLLLVGYLVLRLLPPDTHPAGVTAVVLGIPGLLGWWLLPGAHSFSDVRPFLMLTIAAWVVAFFVPLTKYRTIFVAAAAILLWLWIIGEVAGNDAYSAAPVPSPPAHTTFSLQSFVRGGGRAGVELGDLDSNDPLYGLAQRCSNGDDASCDTLYNEAPSGSDFSQFAATCGNRHPDDSDAGDCAFSSSSSGTSFPRVSPFGPTVRSSNDKSLEIGMVSLLFGLGYLGALYALHRRRLVGLATAFVAPTFLAAITGTEALGNAAHHAWVGGVLTFVVGLAIGVVGHLTGRRFTTWAGGLTVGFGAMIVALDASHIGHAVGGGDVKLAGPGLIVIAFGVALVATGFVVAEVLRRYMPGEGSQGLVDGGGGGGGFPPSGGFGTKPPAEGIVTPAPPDSAPPAWPPPTMPPST